VKKPIFTVCVSLLAATSAAGQWLETTIWLSDSLGGVTIPRCVTYNSTDNTVYVGGESDDCVVVIDGATNQKIARITAGSGVFAFCYNPQDNKVYCADYHDDGVTVIDGTSNRVIATIPVGEAPLCSLLQPSEQQCLLCEH